MRVALVVHDKVLRTAIEAYDGFLFSHTGDGFVAAFASPMCAVNAAIDAQRELGLPVRMGLATGEAELRDGDYFGTVLNRAARVMAAGHGGQILLADSTAGLLSGVDLIDLGPRRLRDLASSVQVFQVQAEGLRTDFPPLRALDVTPGNLRPAVTTFIGRESEVADVQAAVKAHRLVTLTGVGGVGKTRLALEVAARLVDEFPDGVWFFELAAVTDPAAVPDAVAAVLGITQQPGKTVSESVAAALEGRLRLLVFDNCEHVLDAAADLVEAILTQSATVRVVATSREGLGVAQEQVWPVPSLDIGAGIDSAAVSLFVERAQGIAPSFSMVNGDEAAAVTEICQRLDGIPLAIELAASRMASITASEVRDRLDQRFRLLVADRSSGRTRFSMLETIRQFAEEQLVAGGAATEVRAAHSRYFAGRQADILALWDSPRQRAAYDWLTVEFANLRTAFRWAADRGDLDNAATIATYAGFLGELLENYEPVTWAEELIEPARAVDHPRLAFLYAIASQCFMTGRIEAAVRYADAGQVVLGNNCDELPFGLEGMLGAAYLVIGQPERTVEWCRAQIARGRDTHTLTRSTLVVALTMTGCADDAMAAANGLIESAEATRNPFFLSFALLEYGFALRHTDPDRARDALRRGLVIARDSGNRSNETHLAGALSRREVEYGDPLAALEYSAVAIRNYHDAGGTANMRAVLAALAASLDQLGCYEPAATIAGFAFDSLTALWVPELSTAITHLRDLLGEATYESLARKGETMTTAVMVTYAYDQIDQARPELEHPS